MKDTFRQSMAWLHTWAGLVFSWVLYFVFVTGTFGYLNKEIDRWMKPEMPHLASGLSAPALLQMGEDWLAGGHQDAQSWYVDLGAERGLPFSAAWREWPEGDARFGKLTRQALDPETGAPVEIEARETGGGRTLYRMHYLLHYMPGEVAINIVGAATMFLLVAIVTGIVVHKKIFRDFFTFRPGKGQRSWLDAHNLLSVTALPFHLMIAWSSLIFFMFTYMPSAVEALYPDAEERRAAFLEAAGRAPIEPGRRGAPAAAAPLAPMLAVAEQRWGEGNAAYIRIEAPGRDGARVMIYGRDSGLGASRPTLRFDGVTGALLSEGPKAGTPPGRFRTLMLDLHEGRFAGPLLRALYVLSGFAGAAMIATGLVLWSAKRKAKLAKGAPGHFGMAAVDVLNVGTIIGLPVGVAAYFWANRLIPLEIETRGEWEVHAMFIIWGLTYLYAVWRPLTRAWLELAGVAATAYGFIPILNALTTNRGLIESISSGDWVFAGFDLAAVSAGLFFLFLVRTINAKRRRARDAAGPRRGGPTAEAA